MKTPLIFYFLVLQFIYAQRVDNNKTIVKNVLEAIYIKSIDGIEEHLASDFTIAGQQDTIAL